MTPDWLLAIISGTAAALVGITGPAVLFWRSREAQRKDAVAARTDEAVADVMGAAQEIVTRLATSRWGRSSREVMDFVGAGTRFVATELRDHPDISLWVLAEVGEASLVLAEVERRRYGLGYTEAVEEATKAVGDVSAELMLWHQGKRTDAYFRELNDARPAD